ncbi:Phox-like protein [Xylariaceae sp. FL1272]|nr:Phox-like protein [Xylariaceae sp. FL1272]
MASTTEFRFPGDSRTTKKPRDSTARTDPSMPKLQTPPSPPTTETDTDETESPISPFPDFRQEDAVEGHDATTFIFPSIETATATSTSDPTAHLSNDLSQRLHLTMRDSTSGANPESQPSDPAESPVISPVQSPPYWTPRNSQDHPPGHTRTVSSESIPAGVGITMRDNENSSIDERGSACWAKSVQVTDYVVVNGSATNIGAFVVFNVRVETLNGSYMNIRKRYSEFDDFRWRLVRTFPGFEAAVPELPPKSLISKFRPRFLEKRRAGLQYFLHCILLNPEFSGSPVLKEFLFA